MTEHGLWLQLNQHALDHAQYVHIFTYLFCSHVICHYADPSGLHGCCHYEIVSFNMVLLPLHEWLTRHYWYTLVRCWIHHCCWLAGFWLSAEKKQYFIKCIANTVLNIAYNYILAIIYLLCTACTYLNEHSYKELNITAQMG